MRLLEICVGEIGKKGERHRGKARREQLRQPQCDASVRIQIYAPVRIRWFAGKLMLFCAE